MFTSHNLYFIIHNNFLFQYMLQKKKKRFLAFYFSKHLVVHFYFRKLYLYWTDLFVNHNLVLYYISYKNILLFNLVLIVRKKLIFNSIDHILKVILM
jgi:hypothetical protein